jgi:hypothetical protein
VANTDEGLAILIVYLHPILVAWYEGYLRTEPISTVLLRAHSDWARARLVSEPSKTRCNGRGPGLLVANGEAVGEGGTIIVNFYTAIVALLPACAIGIVMCLGLALFFAAIPPIGLVRATMITAVEGRFS